MQVEFRYFKHRDNPFGSSNKHSYYAVPKDLDPFEIVSEIDVRENDSNGIIRGFERFYLIFHWDWFHMCWEGQRSCFNFIREVVVDGEEMADLSILITDQIVKMEMEI